MTDSEELSAPKSSAFLLGIDESSVALGLLIPRHSEMAVDQPCEGRRMTSEIGSSGRWLSAVDHLDRTYATPPKFI